MAPKAKTCLPFSCELAEINMHPFQGSFGNGAPGGGGLVRTGQSEGGQRHRAEGEVGIGSRRNLL